MSERGKKIFILFIVISMIIPMILSSIAVFL